MARYIAAPVGRFIVALAASWAVGASFYIFFTPVNMSGVSSSLRHDTGEIVEVFTRQQSWYEAQGRWGVLVLVIFAAFYVLALPVAWRGNSKGLIIMAVFAIALSVISAFSIGAAYLPAALGLLAGSLLLPAPPPVNWH